MQFWWKCKESLGQNSHQRWQESCLSDKFKLSLQHFAKNCCCHLRGRATDFIPHRAEVTCCSTTLWTQYFREKAGKACSTVCHTWTVRCKPAVGRCWSVSNYIRLHLGSIHSSPALMKFVHEHAPLLLSRCSLCACEGSAASTLQSSVHLRANRLIKRVYVLSQKRGKSFSLA